MKGGFKAHISYSSTPRDQISVHKVKDYPYTISGEVNYGVPIIVLALSNVFYSTRETPKSPI